MTVIRNNLKALKSQCSRLSTSRNVAKYVTQKGSEFEIAAVYSTVTNSLKELCDKTIDAPLNQLGEITYRITVDVSKIELPASFLTEQMNMKKGKEIMKMKKVKEFGTLVNGRGVSFTKGGTIVVANFSATPEFFYHIYSQEGKLTLKVDTAFSKTGGGKASSPWCAVMHHGNERIFGTGNTQHVKQYRKDGTYINRYSTRSPDNTSSEADDSTVQGLALDKNGYLIVGNVTKKYVSIIKTDGTHITSMNVLIKPWFISATPTDNIIISSYEDKAVHVIDRKGKILLTLNLQTNVPKESWNPTGIFCSEDGDIFVANYHEQVGIFQYTFDDEDCVGCNTKRCDGTLGYSPV